MGKSGSQSGLLALPIALLLVLCVAAVLPADPVRGAGEHAGHSHKHAAHRDGTSGRSLSNNQVSLPTWEQFVETVTLQQYNTRIVFFGTLLLGICAATVGTFMLLRKRALMGDVVGHATLPGIGIAFIVMELIKPDSGRWLPGLLIGAFVAALCGIGATTLIRRVSRVKEDTAMAIVLSIFFGLGVALFSIIQNVPSSSVAGIKDFIFGKTGSIASKDVQLIAAVSSVALLIVVLLFKEFALLCFDEGFAATQGFPTLLLDLTLMMLVALVAVIGLQSVGLLLVVALLIIPPAAARFWTDHLWCMTLIAIGFGGIGASSGVLISAMSRAPAGPTIVLVGSLIFVISLFCGPRRGAISRLVTHLRLKRQLDREHLLHECWAYLQQNQRPVDHPLGVDDLLPLRSWTASQIQARCNRAVRGGILRRLPDNRYQLTESGYEEALRIFRNQRLWETYLTEHADVATSLVDRHAHSIDDILEPAMIRELETKLDDDLSSPQMARV